MAAHPYCAGCGATSDLTVDHVVPIARGGTPTPENLQVLCRSCNSAKGARP
jgi:5-methylcytosine-specific restriction endonuclease McrA